MFICPCSNNIGALVRLHIFFHVRVFQQLGAPKSSVNFDAFQIISNGRQIMGSMTGSPGDYEEMLHFCSKFEINPTIELFQMKDINSALDKVN
jgi:D-arabinose 1-dehydrogenase-like Zn-dependent alcohol dehydrogenase